MCSPKIGEDLDEEDEVSDRTKRTTDGDHIDDASDEKDRSGGLGWSRRVGF